LPDPTTVFAGAALPASVRDQSEQEALAARHTRSAVGRAVRPPRTQCQVGGAVLCRLDVDGAASLSPGSSRDVDGVNTLRCTRRSFYVVSLRFAWSNLVAPPVA